MIFSIGRIGRSRHRTRPMSSMLKKSERFARNLLGAGRRLLPAPQPGIPRLDADGASHRRICDNDVDANAPACDIPRCAAARRRSMEWPVHESVCRAQVGGQPLLNQVQSGNMPAQMASP